MVDALAQKGDEGRGVTAISVGELSSELWSGDVRMGKPIASNVAISSSVSDEDANPGKWNISVPGGKEKIWSLYYLWAGMVRLI